jgi:hypothetical protein
MMSTLILPFRCTWGFLCDPHWAFCIGSRWLLSEESLNSGSQ